MSEFKQSISDRKADKFFGARTQILLELIQAEEDPDYKLNLPEEFTEFYETTLEYINNWFRLERFPNQIEWLNLNNFNLTQISYESVKKVADRFYPDIGFDDNLFNEVSALNHALPKIKEYLSEDVEENWIKIFRQNHLPLLCKIVSVLLSIPCSNAFVERVFSLVNSQWTDVRNSLRVETVKALMQIQLNYDFSCQEMHEYILSNNKLLRQIQSDEKYQRNHNRSITH